MGSMATTQRVDTPAFTIESGTVTLEPGDSRTRFTFEANATRHLHGAFKVGGLDLLLFDREGRFIAKQGALRDRAVLANRAGWVHEVQTDRLETATRLVYVVSYRFQSHRKLVAGELPDLPADFDASEYCPWLVPDPRTLADRTAQFDFAIWAHGSGIEISSPCARVVVA